MHLHDNHYTFETFDRACDLTHLSDGEAGAWRLTTVQAPKPSALDMARAAMRGLGRIVPEGTYRVLYHGRDVVMSDTPDERHDHYRFWAQAHGHVLVTGLGLGMMATALLRHPRVTQMTLLEIDPDVVQLTGTALTRVATETGKDLRLLVTDAKTWRPAKDERFDCGWHDIWDALCADNLPEMARLTRRLSRRVRVQDCWGRDICRRLARRGY